MNTDLEIVRSLLGQSSDLVQVVALDGTLLYTNPTWQKVLGYAAEDIAAVAVAQSHPTTVFEVLHADDRDRFRQVCVQLQREKSSKTLQITLVNRHGVAIAVKGQIIYRTDAQTSPQFWCLFQKVGDDHRAEDPLQHLNQQLAATVEQRTAELRNSEERFRSLFEQSPLGISITTLEGQLLQVNHQLCQMTGYAPTDLLGTSYLDLVYPDDHPAAVELFHQVVQAEPPHRAIEKRYVTRTGETIWVQLTCALIHQTAAGLLNGTGSVVHNRNSRKDGTRVDCEWYHSIPLDESGHLAAILSLVQDVTQRKSAELSLQKSETRYRAIVEDQTELIARFLPDSTLLFVNDAYCRYFGKSRAELLEQSYVPLILPEDQPTVQQTLAQMTLEHPVVSYEHRVQLSDGTIRWLQWADRAFFDAQGQIIECQGVGRDITVAREAQAALQRSQQRYHNLVNSIDAIVWEANLNLQCTFVSQQVERILGYPQEQWLEPDFWFTHLHPDDRQLMANFCYDNIAQGQDHTSEYRMIAADGRVVWLRDTTNVVVENGQAQSIQGILIDISDRKQSETQLQQANEQLAIANADLARANRLKDEFLANMSHELRTPLSTILGLAEVLQSQAFGMLTEKQQQFIDTISSSGKHLLALINDILDLAKIESGKFSLDLAAADLRTICETSLNLVQFQAQQKAIVLEAHLPSDPVWVTVDERRLRQVLLNLLSNGVKFTPSGGQVSLQVILKPDANTLCVQVLDTGIGIAAADIPRLFQPFVQIDSSLSRHYEGTGLGLALVRQVVELHGGEVDVTSEPGKGSCFTITLPWRKEGLAGK